MAGLARRDILLLGGAAALVIGWQEFGRRGRDVLEFGPVRGARGWEIANSGQASGLSSTDFMTIGLEPSVPPLDPDRLNAVVHRAQEQGVPVAVFSDFFCPFCRGLLGRLAARTAAPPIAITWHELPLLGDNSVRAARAAVAADLQGGYVTFYDSLLREGFRPSDPYLARVAGRAGLDGDRLRADMEGPVVATRLAESAAAAARLGIFGTPGIAIGQRVVMGALREKGMEQLIARAALS